MLNLDYCGELLVIATPWHYDVLHNHLAVACNSIRVRTICYFNA